MRNKYYLYLKSANRDEEETLHVAQEVPLEEEEEGAEGESGAKPSGGGGGGGGSPKDIPGEWIEFYNDVGDEKIQNPLTGRTIKWKTMITYRDKDESINRTVQKRFDKWKEDKFARLDKEKEEKEEANWDREKAQEDFKKEQEKEGDIEVSKDFSLTKETGDLIEEVAGDDPDMPSREDIHEALKDPEKRKEIRGKLEDKLFTNDIKKKIFEKLKDLLHILGADERDLENLLDNDPALAKGLIEKKEKDNQKDLKKGKNDLEKIQEKEEKLIRDQVESANKKPKETEKPEEAEKPEGENKILEKPPSEKGKKKKTSKKPLSKGRKKKETLENPPSEKRTKLAQTLASMYLSGSRTAKKGKGWSKLPKGWTQKSFDAFYGKITSGGKDPFKACVEKMKGKMDNPEAFCAATLDKYKGTTDWRGEGKKKKETKKKTAQDHYDEWLRSL